MNKTYCVAALLLFLLLNACTSARSTTPSAAPSAPPAPAFQHPGILHSRAELDFIKQKVAAKEQPWFTAWQALQKSPKAALSIEPYPIPDLFRGSRNNPNIGAADFLTDGGIAYTQAIEYVITGNKTYAENAVKFLNAYASTVKTIKGSDAPLVTGEAAVHYCNAAEIIRATYDGWKIEDQKKFAAWLQTVLYPVMKDFKPTFNGNWDAAMIQSMLAMGIFLDDHAMFDRAVNHCLRDTTNGAIRYYFNDIGECQESGRDQGHAQMGLGFLGTACEIAWHQHVDLYGTSNNRLLLGTEYICKYNLGNDVPYTPYKSILGPSYFPTIAPQSRGRFSSIYEKIYHHYHDLKGLDMPFTKQVIDKQRPELDITDSHTPWGTLMFANLPNASQ
jgi:hypothetical protein